MSAGASFPNRGRQPFAIGGREFFYEFPLIGIETNARTVTLEPINEPSITQHMGVESKQIDVDGSCFLDEANYLDDLAAAGDPVSITSERFDGEAILESVTTDPAGFEYEGDRVYDYRLSLREVESEESADPRIR
jgi:hypothetical protein